jgi:hypothetical protein
MESKVMKPVSVTMALISLLMVLDAVSLHNHLLTTIWSISAVTWLVNIKLWWAK